MTTMNFGELLATADTSGGGAPPPPGEYDVVVESAEAKNSSTGKPMIKVRFKILVGPHAGRGIFNNFTISTESAGALSFFFQHMDALGLDRDFFAANPALELVAQTLIGRQAKITGEHRDWNGKAQFDIKKIARPTVGVVAPPVAAVATSGVPAPAPAPAAPAAVPAPVAAPAPVVPSPGF